MRHNVVRIKSPLLTLYKQGFYASKASAFFQKGTKHFAQYMLSISNNTAREKQKNIYINFLNFYL